MRRSLLNPGPILLLVAAMIAMACESSGKRHTGPSPADYDLNNPEVFKLSDRLNEISGLAYYAPDSALFAIVDEAGILYKLIPAAHKRKVNEQHWKFAGSSDFEDLVLVDSVFYVMKSKGDIVAFKFLTPDSLQAQEYNIPLTGKNEFESMYYDEASRRLVLICKDCEADDKNVVSTWTFDPQQHAFNEGEMRIDAPSILGKLDTDEKRFKPSAAAINPLTGELYIVSSVNKCLVIAGGDGKLKEVYPLAPDLFKQPEGIAFTPSGDMFISNEAAGEGLANILRFKYKKRGHEN
ncbi:MAG TPA: SdiA-regulated domain-containing protein [Chitinophagaceae bacterium]